MDTEWFLLNKKLMLQLIRINIYKYKAQILRQRISFHKSTAILRIKISSLIAYIARLGLF